VRAPQSAGGETVRKKKSALGAGDDVGRTVAVFDGQVHVGDVVERADGGGFDAFALTGELIGTFSTPIGASRAIPIAVALDIIAAEADGAAA